MKKLVELISALIIVALLLLGASSVQKNTEEKLDAKQVKIEGEVVDLGCFTTRDARGEGHKTCATRCIKNGNPAGIVDDNGKVYTIAAVIRLASWMTTAKSTLLPQRPCDTPILHPSVFD